MQMEQRCVRTFAYLLILCHRTASTVTVIATSLTVAAITKRSCSDIVAPTSHDGWRWADSPASVGMNKTLIVRGLASVNDSSLAIFATRCGYAFFVEGGVDRPNPVYSVGKTVVTTWAGVMVSSDQWRLDDKLAFSNDPPRAAREMHVPRQLGFDEGRVGGPLRSLRSFLSMTSGFGLMLPKNWTTPNNVAAYSNNAIEFLFSHVKAATRNSTYQPLTDSEVLRGLFDKHLNGHQDAIHLHGQISGYGEEGGLHISARDAARLGLLYLCDGRFGTNGRRVLNADFVANAMRCQVPPDASVSQDFADDARWNIPELSMAIPFDSGGHKDNPRMRGHIGYGYGLWILGTESNSKSGRGSVFHLSGRLGNYVIVDRPSGLVILIMNNKMAHPNAIDYIESFRNAISMTTV